MKPKPTFRLGLNGNLPVRIVRFQKETSGFKSKFAGRGWLKQERVRLLGFENEPRVARTTTVQGSLLDAFSSQLVIIREHTLEPAENVAINQDNSEFINAVVAAIIAGRRFLAATTFAVAKLPMISPNLVNHGPLSKSFVRRKASIRITCQTMLLNYC